MGATFTIEEKVSLSNLAAQIAQVTVLTANLANYNWSTLPGKPTTFVYTDQLYSDPSWLSISKTFVGLGNVENTALSTWAGTSNLRNAGPLTIAGGVQSSLTPFINATQTWNNAAVTFTGVYVNVTDTASNVASLLADLQIGGVSKFKVAKDGSVNAGYFYSFNGGSSSPTYSFTSETNSGIFRNSTGVVSVTALGVTIANFGRNVANTGTAIAPNVSSSGTDIGDASSAGAGRYFNNINCYSWLTSWTTQTSTTSAIRLSSSGDGIGVFANAATGNQVTFALEAANQFAFRNGTTAQSFRVYNTYTDASNYERGVFDWTTTANALTIGTKAAGTGTQRNVIFDGALHRFDIAGSPAVYVQSSGLTPTADGSKSLGQQTTYRWDFIYAKSQIQITGAAGQFAAYNLDPATSGGNNEYATMGWSTVANTFTIGTYKTGGGLARPLLISSASAATFQSLTNGVAIDSASGLILFQKAGTSVWQITTTGTFGTQTDGGQDIGNAGGQRPNNVHILGFLNMYGASNAIDCYNAGLSIRARSATGGIYFATGGTTARWGFDQNGQFLPQVDNTYDIGSSGNSVRQLYLSKTITAAGTTGAQTINKSNGSVNFAAAATSLVVTNSLVTTNSVIVATVGTNDTTMKTVSVTAAAGSFTLTANAAATAETRVNFVVLS